MKLKYFLYNAFLIEDEETKIAIDIMVIFYGKGNLIPPMMKCSNVKWKEWESLVT